MKKLIILCLVLLTAFNCMAQFRLSGSVPGAAGADSITINIPFVYGYYRENNIIINVDNKGNFSKLIDVSEQKFATFEYHGIKTTLLLTPGKAVSFRINLRDTVLSHFKGSASVENQLLYELKMDEIPFFGKGFGKDNPFAKYSNEDQQERVIKPWFAIRDEKLAKINAAKIPPATKALIAQEVKSEAIVQLVHFGRSTGKNRETLAQFFLTIYEHVSMTPEVFPAGPMFYQMANANGARMEGETYLQIEADKATGKKSVLKYYNITADSGINLAKRNGTMFLHWLPVRNTYDKRVAESWLAQAIVVQCYEKDITYTLPLMNEMTTNFPNSKYLPKLTGMVNNLRAALAANQGNGDIHIIDGFEKMTSINQVIASLKGKVVYLDVWGTWCGPCKEEIKHNPALKQHFKGKDVVFVYMDMDNDIQDKRWREFIAVNGITGYHLRKNNEQILLFWEELLPGQKDKQNFYPTYFIFDKNGKLVEPLAKRPSDGVELYRQIEKYL
ncbi:TlpA disulfide reductase family protein [Mucilaginibacter defluvii]|uniref:Thioredoxin domain-containing protein n=1 Tax=Mucilaginibacter defluvii TaxID=1196019 RepID=A0ABP9G4R7_9SPHI